MSKSKSVRGQHNPGMLLRYLTCGNMWSGLRVNSLHVFVWFGGLHYCPKVGDKLQLFWDHGLCCGSFCVPDIIFVHNVSESGFPLKLQWFFSSLHHVSPYIPLKFHLIYLSIQINLQKQDSFSLPDHFLFIMGLAVLVNWELIKRSHKLGYKPF